MKQKMGEIAGVEEMKFSLLNRSHTTLQTRNQLNRCSRKMLKGSMSSRKLLTSLTTPILHRRMHSKILDKTICPCKGMTPFLHLAWMRHQQCGSWAMKDLPVVRSERITAS